MVVGCIDTGNLSNGVPSGLLKTNDISLVMERCGVEREMIS